MIVLTGNGFNFMVKSFISNNTGRYSSELDISQEKLTTLTEEIGEITALWREFDDFFKELLDTYPSFNHEELIKMINSVLEFFSNSDYIQKLIPHCSDSVSELKSGMEEVIINRIMEICKKFRDFENDLNHGLVRRIFPEFGRNVREILKDRNDRVLYLTTNYDGIKDTLLYGSGGLIADGFGNDPQNGNLVLTERNLDFSELLLHLHGSYKFQKSSYETIKLRGTTQNTNPLMIFNQPELKEKQIKSDNVLGEYFRIFKQRLEESKEFIIIGNSLKTEPHIISSIDDFFNKEGNTLYIYDANPEDVKEKLMSSIKDPTFEIKLINTREFFTDEDFIDSLKSHF